MAKELPYFQFEPAQYLTKDISFCSIASQGLFINICSYYWQRECQLTVEQLLRRLDYKKELDELISENIISVNESEIEIKFLDAQYEKATKTSKTNSANGSKGGRPKKEKPTETEIKPKLNPIESESKGIREDKIKEEDKKEDNNTPKAFSFRKSFLELGIDNDILNDWLAVRKKKRAVNSQTAFNLFINEVEKSKINVIQAVELCAGKSWVSFSHKWELDLPNETKVDNPKGEKIITFTSNVNSTRVQLPESQFLELKRRMEGGGYTYKIVG